MKNKIICSSCEGRGHTLDRNGKFHYICEKCRGKQKLDWIENIVGVKPIPNIIHFSTPTGKDSYLMEKFKKELIHHGFAKNKI